MEHKGTVEIQTDRLLLRKFQSCDMQAAFDNWTSDDKVTHFLRWPAHSSVDITKMVIEDWIKGYDNNNFYQWAIVLKEYSDKPIGSIGVVEFNEELNIVHIGYCIGQKWWNKGITSEAFTGIIPFLFNEVKVNRIESQHDPKNPNSGKVMTKCDLKYEGILRQYDINNQGICDAAMYSLLAEEYFSVK